MTRHDNKARSGFTIANLKKTLESVDPTTAKAWSLMYDKTIDFGAHPNPAALVAALKMDEDETRSLQRLPSYSERNR